MKNTLVIIPTYNELENIQLMIDAVLSQNENLHLRNSKKYYSDISNILRSIKKIIDILLFFFDIQLKLLYDFTK